MTPAITLWLVFVLATAVITWFGNKWQAIAFGIVVGLVAPATALPLGHPSFLSPPAGQYKVLGARIDVDKAIYILLDASPEPRFYKLPYSRETAGELQNAQDAADAHGSSVVMQLGGGSADFAEGTERDMTPTKQAETPLISN